MYCTESRSSRLFATRHHMLACHATTLRQVHCALSCTAYVRFVHTNCIFCSYYSTNRQTAAFNTTKVQLFLLCLPGSSKNETVIDFPDPAAYSEHQHTCRRYVRLAVDYHLRAGIDTVTEPYTLCTVISHISFHTDRK